MMNLQKPCFKGGDRFYGASMVLAFRWLRKENTEQPPDGIFLNMKWDG